MQMKQGSSITDTAVVLLLIGIFVLLATGVLTLGVSVYNNTTVSASENYTHRTALSYIANQVRRGDTAGGIEVRSLDGVDALALRSEIGGTGYITYLYCYDGQLRELFTEEGVEQELASGTVVMPLAELGFSLDGGNIDVTATDGAGNARSLILSPRSGVAEG
ncbi:MAG: DUF4860 domain-containing protein [Clostridiales Family XIII bacterium]|jgi:hypothetical protein|nr:DUF4860 domain-containing protein [Clostridiales Family XIII bacterium]